MQSMFAISKILTSSDVKQKCKQQLLGVCSMFTSATWQETLFIFVLKLKAVAAVFT
jgi:hypothetical protein